MSRRRHHPHDTERPVAGGEVRISMPGTHGRIPPGKGFDVLCKFVAKLHGTILAEDLEAIVIIGRTRASGGTDVLTTTARATTPQMARLTQEQLSAVTQQLLVDALARLAQGDEGQTCLRCGEVHE